MHSRKFKIPTSFVRQCASMLMASAVLLTTWICSVEGAIHPQVTQGQVVADHLSKSPPEDDPNDSPHHSHGPSQSDESTDLCCSQVLVMRRTAFQQLAVEGPVAWQLGAGSTGESYGKRYDSLASQIDLAPGPIVVHKANSYYFAMPAHAPPLFS